VVVYTPSESVTIPYEVVCCTFDVTLGTIASIFGLSLSKMSHFMKPLFESQWRPSDDEHGVISMVLEGRRWMCGTLGMYQLSRIAHYRSKQIDKLVASNGDVRLLELLRLVVTAANGALPVVSFFNSVTPLPPLASASPVVSSQVERDSSPPPPPPVPRSVSPPVYFQVERDLPPYEPMPSPPPPVVVRERGVSPPPVPPSSPPTFWMSPGG
jgi:hypothetical protein